MRIDQYLFLSGFARSRTHASNLIRLGKVLRNGTPVEKSATEVGVGDTVEVIADDDYASLGGIKLKKALDRFGITLDGAVCIDIGASNGGFTDVMLRAGAAKVYAVDVAECALPETLQEDPRVVVKDRLNARYLTFEDIGIRCDFMSIDVSFISLRLILPPLAQILKMGGEVVALIKPQFEAGKELVEKGGVVRDKNTHILVIQNIINCVKSLNYIIKGLTFSSIKGPAGNIEYLIWFSTRGDEIPTNIQEIVNDAHNNL